MKTYEHELAHSYEHSKSIWRYSSGSFLQSLSTALVLGIMAVLIEHLGEFLGRFDPRSTKQVKPKRRSLERRNRVLIKLHHNERLAVTHLNCETAVAALSFWLRHTAMLRQQPQSGIDIPVNCY